MREKVDEGRKQSARPCGNQEQWVANEGIHGAALSAASGATQAAEKLSAAGNHPALVAPPLLNQEGSFFCRAPLLRRGGAER